MEQRRLEGLSHKGPCYSRVPEACDKEAFGGARYRLPSGVDLEHLLSGSGGADWAHLDYLGIPFLAHHLNLA